MEKLRESAARYSKKWGFFNAKNFSVDQKYFKREKSAGEYSTTES